MFVPPSPSQAGDNPRSARQRMTPTLSGEGKMMTAVDNNTSSGNKSATGASEHLGRMVDSRRLAGTAAGSESSSNSGASGGHVVPTVEAVADRQRPTSRVSLSEATQILDGEDWRPKVAALRQIQDQLTTAAAAAAGAALGEGLGAEDSRDLLPFIESLAAVCVVLSDTRPEISGAARVTQLVCAVVSGIVRAVGSVFCTPAAVIIPELLPFLSTPREAVQEAVAGSVEDILAVCHSPGVLRAATVSLVGSKKAFLRRKGSGFLCVAVERWPRAALRTTLPPIMSQMRRALFDADATVRREGRHTFGEFIRTWPAEGGGMYHALDRANQRAVLQEQPHVSNFISSRSSSSSSSSSSSGGSNADVATATGSAVAGAGAGAGAGAAAVPAIEASSAPSVSAAADDDAAAGTSGTAVAAAATAAAAALAATRMVMATGRGGGGGQRPAGMTQAQHRSLVALKVERDRRLRDQCRLAAAGVTKGSSSLYSTKGGKRSLRNAAAMSAAIDRDSASQDAAGGLPLSSIPAAMNVKPPCSPAAAAAAVDGGFGNQSCSTGGGSSASRIPAPSSSCSNGLRKAARLALRKNNLMSPTLRRLLEDPSQLRTGASVAATDVSSPGSEESELDTEEVGGGGSSGGGGWVGGGGCGGQMTPSELRGSTIGVARLSAEEGGSSSDGNDSFFSSSSSSSSSDGDDEGTEEEQNASARKRRRNMQLPSRVLFGRDGEEKEPEADQQQQSPKQQRISAIARAAANASATRHAALEMKPPPPRPPTSSSAAVAAAKASAAPGVPAPISSLPTDATIAAAFGLDGLVSPGTSARNSVDCTPTKGILMDRSATEGDAATAAAAASSTVKRRVRFDMEERARAAASLTSPCRSSSSLAAGLWSTESDDDEVDDDGYGYDEGSGYYERRRSSAPLRVVLTVLATSVSVGVVAFLGGGRSAGIGGGGGGGGAAYYGNTASTSAPSTTSSTSTFSSFHVPWAEQHHQKLRQQSEVCPGVDVGQPVDGGSKPGVPAVKEEGQAVPEEDPEEDPKHATAGEVLVEVKEVSADAHANDDLVENTPQEKDLVGGDAAAAAATTAAVVVRPSEKEEDDVAGRQEEGDEGLEAEGGARHTSGGAFQRKYEEKNEEEQQQEEEQQEEVVDHDRRQQPLSHHHPQHQHHPHHNYIHQGGDEGGEAIGATTSKAEDVGGVRQSGETIAGGGSSPQSPPSPRLASGPSSVWGWLEVGMAVIGAVVLLAAVVVWNSRGSEEWGGGGGGWGGGGRGAGEGPSTPGRGGSGGDGENLGRYETVEMIKKGGTPATLRSVKRSRRIGSAQKSSSASETVIMDLGATALDLSRA